jgi:hypothetical protein
MMPEAKVAVSVSVRVFFSLPWANNRRPSPRIRGWHHEPAKVDHVLLAQRTEALGASAEQEIPAWLLCQTLGRHSR